MKKRYSTRQRLIGFSCALLMLVLLAACASTAPKQPSQGSPGKSTEPASTEKVPDTIAPTIPASEEASKSAAAEKPGASTTPIATTPPEVRPDSGYGEGSTPDAAYEPGSGGGYAYDTVGSPSATGAAPSAMPRADSEPAPSKPGADSEASDPKAQPFVLTAAEWNDNANWPFFTNLVKAGTIAFPAFGIDPRNRVAVTVTDADGRLLPAEAVELRAADDSLLWRATTDKDGVAYLFFLEGETPDHVTAAGTSVSLTVETPNGSGQGMTFKSTAYELTVVGTASAAARTALQVMFIVDTTGSMSDELSYLQMDFSKIAEDVGTDGVSYAACFYRDEGDDYVTRVNPFTSDLAEVQAKINAEYADGGGDEPEAVDRILAETLAAEAGWNEDCEKLAFLIFDAPPHGGKEAALQAAIRSAAEQGIRLVPVVASNAARETELFGRAIAICTGGTYVFLTDDSGVGGSHLEPIVGDYDVELLHDVIVRIIERHKVG